MEAAVAGDPSLVCQRLLLDLGEGGIEAGDVGWRCAPRRFLGDRALDEGARAQHLERTFDRLLVDAAAARPQRHHVDAGADADLEAALDLERDQGFADGGARHAQRLGQLAFGRQPAADGIFAAVNALPQLIGNLLVETARLCRCKRQAIILEA